MIRNIIAVIVGNLSWTALWLSYNAVLKTIGQLPADPNTRVESISALSLLLVGSVCFSVVAGLVTATVGARGSYGPVLALCVIQVALGIFFQLQFWKLMPLAYHVPFLLLLAPATILGGWLQLG